MVGVMSAQGDGVKSGCLKLELELDMASYFQIHPERRVMYDLVGAGWHKGNTSESGHWTAIVRDGKLSTHIT